MFAVVGPKNQEIKRLPELNQAFAYATKLANAQPMTKKNKSEVARTPTYNIVEV